MASLFRDVTFSARTLAAKPGLTLVAVMILALGIGATTAVYSVVNGVLLRPLPYPQADRLVDIRQTWQEDGPGPTSPANFRDWRDRARSFESMAAYHRGSANISGDGPPERLDAASVTAGFFAVMRVRPGLGRGFEAREDRPGADPVVVISHGLWRRRFAGDAGVVGRLLRLNGEVHTIVGVAPSGFHFPGETDVWTPAAFDTSGQPGALVGAVRSAVLAVDPDLPVFNARPVDDVVAGSLGRRRFTTALLGLFAGAALLLASIGVYGVLSYAVNQRSREVGIRMALGARHLQVMEMVVRQGMRPVMAGIVVGLVSAVLLARVLSTQLYGISTSDPATFGVVAVVLVVSALLASVLPGLRMTRIDSTAVLRPE